METPAWILTILIPLASYYLVRPKQNNSNLKTSSCTQSSLLPDFLWYKIGLFGIFCLGAAIRFKDLSRFNMLIWDEQHFVNFANKYLNNTYFFDAHPPLAKYIIAIGIWIGQALGVGQDVMNNETGNLLSPISYRWMNAFVGSLIPVMLASLASKLSQRRAFALITGYFAALDGLFIIESRYALLEVYIVFFGLFAQLALLKALKAKGFWYHFWMILAGIGFGAAVSAKWSGLGFWGPVIALWVANEILQRLGSAERFLLRNLRKARNFFFNLGIEGSIKFKIDNGKAKFTVAFENLKSDHQVASSPTTDSTCSENISTSIEETDTSSFTTFTPFTEESPLKKLEHLNLTHIIFYLGILPAAFYIVHWIPHIKLHPDQGFYMIHRQMLGFHQQVDPDDHPFCSRWYTWPLMLRPICVYDQEGPNYEYFQSVHSFSNPFLWWFSTIAIIAMLLIVVRETFKWVFRIRQDNIKDQILPSAKSWISLYLLVNWAANFLPYTMINRCVFIYHYMPSLIYAEIALAWLVDNWLRSQRVKLRLIAVSVLFVVSASFVYFEPIIYGNPMDYYESENRLWLDSWRSWK